MEKEQYIHDIKMHSVNKLFLVEDIVEGHEVDADIVIYDKKLLYGKVSDNFLDFII